MNKNFSKIKNPLCILPKYLYGSKKYGLSPEYNALYLPLKKKFKNLKFFDSLKDKNLEKFNKQIISYCEKHNPDYIFFSVFHYEIYLETLAYLKTNLKIFLINWSSDDSWRFDQHSKILSRFFDCMITNSISAKFFYTQNRINHILSSWGCPDNWYKKVSKTKSLKYDILFVGKSYFDRKKIISKLKEKYRVTCYGSGWGTRSLKDHEMSKIFRKAKVSLNFSKSRGDLKQVKARVFEIAGSGGFCLTENSKELKNFFNGSEVDSFNSFSELTSKIDLYLKNYKLRIAMSSRANIKVKKQYLYSKIVNKIILKILKMKKNNNACKEPSLKSKEIYLLLLYIGRGYKFLLVNLLNIFMQKEKAWKITRRLMFELEWRFRGGLVYSKYGLCNKLYDVCY